MFLSLSVSAHTQRDHFSDARNILFNNDDNEKCVLQDLILPCCITAEPNNAQQVKNFARFVFNEKCKNKPIVNVSPEKISIGEKDSLKEFEITASYNGIQIRKKIALINLNFEGEDKEKTEKLQTDIETKLKLLADTVKENFKKAFVGYGVFGGEEGNFFKPRVFYKYNCCAEKESEGTCITKGYRYSGGLIYYDASRPPTGSTGNYRVSLRLAGSTNSLPKEVNIEEVDFVTVNIRLQFRHDIATFFRVDGCEPLPYYVKPYNINRSRFNGGTGGAELVIKYKYDSRRKNDTLSGSVYFKIDGIIRYYPDIKLCIKMEIEPCTIKGKIIRKSKNGKDEEIDVEVSILSKAYKTYPVCF